MCTPSVVVIMQLKLQRHSFADSEAGLGTLGTAVCFLDSAGSSFVVAAVEAAAALVVAGVVAGNRSGKLPLKYCLSLMQKL